MRAARRLEEGRFSSAGSESSCRSHEKSGPYVNDFTGAPLGTVDIEVNKQYQMSELKALVQDLVERNSMEWSDNVELYGQTSWKKKQLELLPPNIFDTIFTCCWIRANVTEMGGIVPIFQVNVYGLRKPIQPEDSSQNRFFLVQWPYVVQGSAHQPECSTKQKLSLPPVEIEVDTRIYAILMLLIKDSVSLNITTVCKPGVGSLWVFADKIRGPVRPIGRSDELWRPVLQNNSLWKRQDKSQDYHINVMLQYSSYDNAGELRRLLAIPGGVGSPIESSPGKVKAVEAQSQQKSSTASHKSRAKSVKEELLKMYKDRSSFMYHGIHQKHLTQLILFFAVEENALKFLSDANKSYIVQPSSWPTKTAFRHYSGTQPSKGVLFYLLFQDSIYYLTT